MAMPLVLVLLPLFITGGSGSLMSTENVDDVVTKCFDGPLDREDPLRPECTKAFMQFAVDSKTQLHLSKEEINYLWSIEREIQGKMYKHRHKRQASRIYLPIRRECRLMGEAERLKLFRAVNILKHDTRISGDQNVYDLIAFLHYMIDLHIHEGSFFLGWHRVYLVVYETALRRAIPDVTLCFWDSTMEDRLGKDQWKDTAVFSDEFFGNSKGKVITGPFANWTLPPFIDLDYVPFLPRNFNERRAPVNLRAANLIFYGSNSKTHTQVTRFGTDQDVIIVDGFSRRVQIETEHDNVHVWVGGAMAFVTTSTFDPIFFFHHTYIDYMWELFRIKMKFYGNDPTSDYPGHGRNGSFSAADDPMIRFEAFRNIDGYSDFFTQYLYQYESPSCQACFQSPWTICDKLGQCVARTNMPGTEVVEGPDQRSELESAGFGAFRIAGASMPRGREFPLPELNMLD